MSRTLAEQLVPVIEDFYRAVPPEMLAGLPLAEQRMCVEDALEQTRRDAARTAQPLTCRGKGCNGCCRGEIALMPSEAQRLVAGASDAALDRAWAAREEIRDLERQRQMVCPLLDPVTGLCEQYEERPLVCRAYHAVSPPDWCWPERAGARDVGSYGLPSAIAIGILIADQQSRPDEPEDPSLADVLLARAILTGRGRAAGV